MNTVLMTGITGFLGSQIARKLAQRADVAIYAVVRSRGNQTPLQRTTSLAMCQTVQDYVRDYLSDFFR